MTKIENLKIYDLKNVQLKEEEIVEFCKLNMKDYEEAKSKNTAFTNIVKMLNPWAGVFQFQKMDFNFILENINKTKLAMEMLKINKKIKLSKEQFAILEASHNSYFK